MAMPAAVNATPRTIPHNQRFVCPPGRRESRLDHVLCNGAWQGVRRRLCALLPTDHVRRSARRLRAHGGSPRRRQARQRLQRREPAGGAGDIDAPCTGHLACACTNMRTWNRGWINDSDAKRNMLFRKRVAFRAAVSGSGNDDPMDATFGELDVTTARDHIDLRRRTIVMSPS